MATITAADVKKLRDLTGAGMMECKKALEESDGDIDKAIEALRISGAAKAAKRGAERTTANGLVASQDNVMVELLCETDFVAKSEDFQALAGTIVATAAQLQVGDQATLAQQMMTDGRTVDQGISDLAGIIGEKLELGRVALLKAPVAVYMHKRASDLPPQVGVMVSYTGNEDDARSAAMQVAAMRPSYVTRDEVPADVVATLPATVLNILLSNLVGNAFAHTRGGRLVIDMEGRTLRIANPGHGVREEDFAPFAKGADSNGFGLGLSIVRRIIHWHDGRALISQSKSLGGACFSLSWPRQQEPR